MKPISNFLLPMLLGLAACSTTFAGSDNAEVRGIPAHDVMVRCEKHYIDRTGTQVFRWDPIGADPRPTTVLYFDVDGAREFQRLPLHLGMGDVALVTAAGHWKFSAGGPFYTFRPGGDGTLPERTLTGYRAATGSLLMDVHYGRYADHFVFSGDDQPIAVHGPCDSLVFIAHDQVATPGVDSKGVLHVRVQLLNSLLIAAGEGKGYVK
jgi:hypothetical protein